MTNETMPHTAHTKPNEMFLDGAHICASLMNPNERYRLIVTQALTTIAQHATHIT